MTTFAQVLAATKARARRHASSRPRPTLAFSPADPTSAACAREAHAAYEAALAPSPPPAARPDPAALRRAIAAARADAPRLRALRRIIARAAHPDRAGGDAAVMKECNAQIDAALASLSGR